MSNNLNVQYVGPTPFSTGASPLQGSPQRQPMSYVMSYPVALHHQGEVQDSVLPPRSMENFFKQGDAAAAPTPLLTSAQQAVKHDPLIDMPIGGYRKATNVRDSDFPRDTLHPLISQHQAEENAKYAGFHPEVGYLANARRNGPPCAAHKPPAFLTTSGSRASASGADELPTEDTDADFSTTKHRVKFYSKRGDLSTVSGRRFYTEGCVQEPDHYASGIVDFANTQPSSFTSIAAKALANALHINKPATPAFKGPSYKLLSPEVTDVLVQRHRSGRHQVENVVLKKHGMMQPPPLKADNGVDVEAVDVPHDPFADRHFKAVNDKPDPIDKKGLPPKDREEILGGASQMNLWSKFVDEYRGLSGAEQQEAKGMRVLASGHISFYTGISQSASISRFLTSKGIRQGDEVKQPTQLSKSSFLETGVIPCSQFTDLELVPPNAVGMDSDRLGIVFRNYGKDLHEIFLEGCTWISVSSLMHIATYCPNLRLLNLSRCPQITDALLITIVSKCPLLKAVNLSNTDITCTGLHALLKSTSLEGLFLSGMETLDAMCDPVWTEMYRHRNLKYFDASFCFNLSDGAVVSIAQHCRKLEVLDITGCNSLTNTSIQSIGYSLRHLRVLNVRLCSQFQPAAICAIGQACTQLTDLNLTGLLCVTTAVIDELLARCPVIVRLSLRGCNKIDDESLSQIARRCRVIEELDISGCIQVTLAGLMQLIHEQKGLKKVNISDTKFSGAEQSILANVREACEVIRSEYKPRAHVRINIYRQVDPPKKAANVDPKAKKR